MLTTKNDEQRAKIDSMMECMSCHAQETGVKAGDEFISYDEMASIVDYLRENVNKCRWKARQAAMNSHIDKLWVSGNTIFLIGVCKPFAVRFIQSLAEFGYNTQELMDEYNKKRIITI